MSNGLQCWIMFEIKITIYMLTGPLQIVTYPYYITLDRAKTYFR